MLNDFYRFRSPIIGKQFGGAKQLWTDVCNTIF
jgi:hypothetical protein